MDAQRPEEGDDLSPSPPCRALLPGEEKKQLMPRAGEMNQLPDTHKKAGSRRLPSSPQWP
ncbi:hypothetical protein Sa4125_41540 [Aureimonas sp. SA4125]|nr:hypothetical protein Sa4125_41540 [Aureimonas sp. SA4125]